MNKLEYTVTLESPALTGQNGVIGKDIDIVTLRDEDNLPYFKAGHIKGILKDRVEQLSKTLNDKLFDEHYKFFGKDGGLNTAVLRFSDLIFKEINGLSRSEILKNNYENLKNDICYDDRHGIKLNRHTLTTEEGSLFSYEFINRNSVFSGTIEFEMQSESEREYIRLIIAALFQLNTIGGQKSRGLGGISVIINGKVHSQLDDIVSDFKVKNTENNQFSLYKPSDKTLKMKYELDFEENIVLKSREIGNVITSLDYIHGGSVRGAIIQYLLDNCGLPETEINEELPDSLIVSQAIPDGTKLVSASSFGCKYSEKCGNNIIIDKVFNDHVKECSKCHNKLERIGNGYLGKDNKKITINKKSDVGIGINYATGTSAEGRIYNREVLRIQQNKVNTKKFSGTITLTESAAQLINNKILYIGKYKTKGFGKCKISLTDYEKESDIRKKIMKQLSSNMIVLICKSDIVLPFISLSNHTELIKIMFLSGNPDIPVSINTGKTFINYGIIGGYNAVNNIRKQDDMIISHGSVITFDILSENLSESDKEKIADKISVIIDKGIGVRKSEGFGEIDIKEENHE